MSGSAAPMQPATVGTLTSGNSHGSQLPSIACCMVLSSPSRAAAKQHTARPKTSSTALLRPQNVICARLQTEYPINPSRAGIISVVTVVTVFPK